MKAWRGNCNKSSHILNPHTKWKWLISVTLLSVISCRNNCMYSILQGRNWVGPRSSLHVVVKTGIPTTDKEFQIDGPKWRGCWASQVWRNVEQSHDFDFTLFLCLLKMKNHGQVVYVCISPLKVFNIFQQNMIQSLHITVVCRIYFFLLTTFISQQTQTEQFNFCLFKDMMIIMMGMTIITTKIETWRKIQISFRPAACGWKTFFDILYTEWYAKENCVPVVTHSYVPKCLKLLPHS